MKRIIVGLWRGLRAVQRFVGTLLFVAVTIFLLSLMMRESRPDIPDGAALVLDLNGIVVEQRSDRDPFELVSREITDDGPPQIQLRDVIAAIDGAGSDKRIKALVLSLGRLAGGGPSKLHRIGAALDKFRAGGKPVVALGDGFTRSQYLIAAHADTILMHPHGNVLLDGYGRFRLYYKGLLDKLKVTANVFRVGTFKSAIEPYIRDDMSAPAREANQVFLGDLWADYIDDVETARKLPPGAVMAYASNIPALQRAAGGDLAKTALDAGLVDALKTRVGQRRHMIEMVGRKKNTNSYNAVGYQDYLRAVHGQEKPRNDRIGVIVAAGEIVDGQAPAGTIGGDTLAKLIRKARENKAIKAIVLRVDSGGGSAFASEIIRNELRAVQAAGKPVVVSMGSVAASGGYWISANADEIWAAPMTITGSIGIFGFIPTFENSLDMLGVHADGVGTTPLSGVGVTRELPAEIADIVQQAIELGYQRFIELVAEARGKTASEVDAIAQGRVWSGRKAKELGLVDHLGYLEDALAAAGRLAKVEDYGVQYIEQKPSFWQALALEILNKSQLMAGTEPSRRASPLIRQIRRMMGDFSLLAAMNDRNHAYALCLACLSVPE